ncbi:ATP-binding protein [Gemmata sp. JC673]|uniref:histidine kinase n=1 Tax=Gemmata algarum TaxID=2975278 RepID=A0ABU5F1I4_9BACT|nr:ATP-binding protein [Gemmata algarum]MDY3561438.1 ATP-binding protein [Gemmata algarum]
MSQFLFARSSWPFVALGGLLAAACLASTWYINRLQGDLARAVRHDAARMEAADEFQVQLRHLRFHSVVCAADPTGARREVVRRDTAQADAALAAIRADITAEDAGLLAVIESDYATYKQQLGPGAPAGPITTLTELVRWSDAHPMRDLLQPCRELSDRQRARMDAGLARSEADTAWAGRVLLALGSAGAFGGLVTGYATARGQRRRAAQLSVRVRAVQSQLDQEVGALSVDPPTADLGEQFDRVVERVTEVCRRLQDQERDLLRAEQLAAVGRLAAGVAHEVRNPLTGIKLLVEGALRPANRAALTDEDLDLIRQEIVRMERTVQGLLDFARTPPLECRPHDLRALVSEAVNRARARAERKPVAVKVERAATPLAVSADRDQMLSLLTNLLFNAVDATPAGGNVSVRVERAPDGAPTVTVSDSGPGIAPETMGKLFTPFATTKPTGTGLGLTVARRIARDHGGALTATNRPEGGAMFALTLPKGAGSDE